MNHAGCSQLMALEITGGEMSRNRDRNPKLMELEMKTTTSLGQWNSGRHSWRQDKHVMDAMQSMRAKAQQVGTLKTTPQQVVEVTNVVVSLAAGYMATVNDKAPTDLKMDGFRISFTYGWHKIVEGQKRLKSEE